MFKKIFFLFFIFLSVTKAIGQRMDQQEPFYINLFISADKTIFVETDKTDFNEVETKVADIIKNMPFKVDQKIVYRIFAEENLKHGYIMDVNREMLLGYDDNVQTSKYLLNTLEFNIDGQNWFKKIDIEKLKKIN